MQDDAYLIAADGWVAKTSRILEIDKKGKTKDRGWTCELIPKPLIVARYFAKEQAALDALQAELDAAAASQTELEEEQGGEEGIFARLRQHHGRCGEGPHPRDRQRPRRRRRAEAAQAVAGPGQPQSQRLKKQIREGEAALDILAYEKYPTLKQAEIQSLVIDDKWMATLAGTVHRVELDRAGERSQTLARWAGHSAWNWQTSAISRRLKAGVCRKAHIHGQRWATGQSSGWTTLRGRWSPADTSRKASDGWLLDAKSSFWKCRLPFIPTKYRSLPKTNARTCKGDDD
jgi:hypothetical protein